MEIGPRQWKRSSYGGNSRPSNDVNRRPRRSCSRRWIPAAAAAVAVDVGRAGDAAGTGGTPCSEEVAARNAEVASSGAALPWPPPGTASPSTAAEAEAVVAVDSAPAAVRNQNRWIASSFFLLSLFCVSRFI